MALKLTQKALAQVRANIQALGNMDAEVRYTAQEQLLAWLAESPGHHIAHLLELCSGATSERQKRRLGAILGEGASLITIPRLAITGLQSSHSGTIARRAIGYWAERAPMPEIVQGLCLCLEISLNNPEAPLLDYILELTTECVLRTPDAAFWPVLRIMKSQPRKHPEAAKTAAYLADILPTGDLPRPSAGTHSSNANLPTPAENDIADKNDLPTPALAPKMQAHRSWWRRWIR